MAGIRELAAMVVAVPALGADNGLALTPPMGWSTWNAFHGHFTEQTFLDQADAMVTNGMQSAGYEYINVDSGWWNMSGSHHIVRDPAGFPQWSDTVYPSGLPHLIQVLHSKGFKYGHYTDAGKTACNHDGPMSEGYEHQDATKFAEWGIDMIKIDSCGVSEDNQTLSHRWATELKATGRPILFSNCHNGCVSPGGMKPDYSVGWADWCSNDANMWRTSADIRPTWTSVMFNLHSLQGMGSHGGPGQWNDPDFLVVGLGPFGKVSTAQAHFTMWCITSSPLILSVNLPKVKQEIIDVVTDADAILVNKQYAGNAGDLLQGQGNISSACMWGMCYNVSNGEVWYKPLPGGEAAVALLNTEPSNGTSIRLNVSFSSMPGLGPDAEECTVFDIWGKNSTVMQDEIVVEELQPMSVKFYRISKCKPRVFTSGDIFLA